MCLPCFLPLSYAFLHAPSNVTWLQETQADLATSCTNLLTAHVHDPHLLTSSGLAQAFDMYTSNPLEGNAYGGVPPAKPTPEWKELQTARQRVGLMLVAHAKAQPQALLPHLAALANKIQEMWASGAIGTNEQSTLFDVILAAAAGADIQLQKQVSPVTMHDLVCISLARFGHHHIGNTVVMSHLVKFGNTLLQ